MSRKLLFVESLYIFIMSDTFINSEGFNPSSKYLIATLIEPGSIEPPEFKTNTLSNSGIEFTLFCKLNLEEFQVPFSFLKS